MHVFLSDGLESKVPTAQYSMYEMMPALNVRIVIKESLYVFQIPVTLPVEILAFLSLEIRTTLKATRCGNVVTQEIEFI